MGHPHLLHCGHGNFAAWRRLRPLGFCGRNDELTSFIRGSQPRLGKEVLPTILVEDQSRRRHLRLGDSIGERNDGFLPANTSNGNGPIIRRSDVVFARGESLISDRECERNGDPNGTGDARSRRIVSCVSLGAACSDAMEPVITSAAVAITTFARLIRPACFDLPKTFRFVHIQILLTYMWHSCGGPLVLVFLHSDVRSLSVSAVQRLFH